MECSERKNRLGGRGKTWFHDQQHLRVVLQQGKKGTTREKKGNKNFADHGSFGGGGKEKVKSWAGVED